MQEEHNINLQHESEGALKIPSDFIEDIVYLQIPISENSDIEKAAEEIIEMPQELYDYLAFGTSNYSTVNALNFLETNSEYINSIDNNGDSPLMKLIIAPNAANYLLEHGANPNIQNNNINSIDNNGDSPFMKLITDPDAINYLLEHGANPNIQNNKGKTALMMVVETQESISTLFINNVNVNIQDDQDDYESLKTLLKHGVDVNLQDNQGNTALISTTISLTSPILKIKYTIVLLEYGANPNIQNNNGETALMKEKNPFIVERLLKYKADLNIKNNQGETALSLAASKNMDEKTYQLLIHGADLASLKEDQYRTPYIRNLIQNANIADRILTEENFTPQENHTLTPSDISDINKRIFYKVLNKLDKNDPLNPLETEKFHIASQVLSDIINDLYANKYNNFKFVDRALETYANAGHKLITNDQKHINQDLEHQASENLQFIKHPMYTEYYATKTYVDNFSKKEITRMLADAINSFTKFPEHIQKMECEKYNISFNNLKQQIGEYNFKINHAILCLGNYSKIPSLFSKLPDDILRIIGEFIGSLVISNAYKASIYRALKPIKNNESKGTEK